MTRRGESRGVGTSEADWEIRQQQGRSGLLSITVLETQEQEQRMNKMPCYLESCGLRKHRKLQDTMKFNLFVKFLQNSYEPSYSIRIS
jgi:hypothetical protein